MFEKEKIKFGELMSYQRALSFALCRLVTMDKADVIQELMAESDRVSEQLNELMPLVISQIDEVY